MTRWIKWGAIATLTVVVAWTCYQWGQSVAREEAAEARTEAVAEAQREAERRLMEEVARARVRAREHAERVETLRSEVSELERTAERYASSEAGQQECLGDEGMERWNAL